MSLKSNIQTIVSQMTTPPNFGYSRRSEANINLDNDSFPRCILIEPDTGGFNINDASGQARFRNNTFIQFLNETVMGEQAIDREDVVNAMKLLAVEFILKLNASNLYQDIPEANYNWVLLVDYYDANTAGIELNIVLTDKPVIPGLC